MTMLQEGGHLPGPKSEHLLALGEEFSEETQQLTKQESLLERGTVVGSGRLRESRRTALLYGLQSWVLW